MYHSVIFGDKNTYDDWKIVPSERPVFVPPAQKTTYLDIPGTDGSLDVSDSLTGYPIYQDREGSFSFYVLNSLDYDDYNFASLYSEIMTYIHGKRMHAILEDDPNWYYDGRFWVDSWTPDNYHSKISIKYRVDPYKWSIHTSSDPNWLWDPFNFEEDMITASLFKDIEVRSGDRWTKRRYLSKVIGQAPACPTFTVNSKDRNGMDVFIKNYTVDRYVETHLDDGVSTKHNIMIFGGEVEIGFKNEGTVSVDFRRGRL